MLKRIVPLLCFPLFLLTACPDDHPKDMPDASPPAPDGSLAAPDASNPTPDASAGLEAQWDHECDRFATCPQPRDAAKCKAQFPCMAATMRPDVLTATVACEQARQCGQIDDACYDVGSLGLTPSQAATTFQNDCLAKRQACSNSFNDDTCLTEGIFQDSVIASLASCLDAACDAVPECIGNTIISASPTCAGL